MIESASNQSLWEVVCVSEIESIARAASQVLGSYNVSQAWLFGSCARGDQTDESDIDLRLVCGPSVGYGDLYEIAGRLESLLGRPVQLVTSPLESMRPAFRGRLLADQVMVYEAA